MPRKPGEPRPFVERIAANRVERTNGARAKDPSLLAGLIFDAGGERMIPTHANKKGRRYRYYVTQSLIKRGRPRAADSARRVPAGEVERLVEERIVSFLKDEEELHGLLAERISEAREIETQIAEASSLAERWPRMAAAKKRQRLRGLISRITLNPESLEIRIRSAHLIHLLRSGEEIGATETMALSDEPVLVLTITARLKRTGMEKKLLIGGAKARSGTKADASLLKLITRAHELQEIFTRGGCPISEMAEAASVSSSHFTRMLRLSFLASDITRTILHGCQPADLTARSLVRYTHVPIDWDEQRSQFGFV